MPRVQQIFVSVYFEIWDGAITKGGDTTADGFKCYSSSLVECLVL